jgi:murein DD-endopeptidase MepM/ murein hydrolase activator NlpD
MTRRSSRLTVLLVALLTVGGSIVTTPPRDPALAADPLAEARAQKASIEAQLSAQRTRLAQLKVTSAQLSEQLDIAKAELAQVTAEYQRVLGLLEQVRVQVAEITARLAELRAQIVAINKELQAVAADIDEQNQQLAAREALLQDHMRAAYERAQVSLLEVLLSAESLDAVTSQFGYLLTVSEQDKALAAEIRLIREQLVIKEQTLADGREALRESRDVAAAEERLLAARQAELKDLERQTAELKAAAERKKAEQEAALNAALEAEGNVAAQIAANERAFAAANQLVNQLVAEQAALEEARRRAAEEASNRAGHVSARGFMWPEASFVVTQEWGPTNFAMEPPYTYNGTYYPHFHGGIDIAGGCATPIRAAGTGVVVAAGRPLWPWDPGYGVVIDHGGGVQTWYWHVQTNIVVRAGQPVTVGQRIAYEGSTGFSTGCHLHFAVNDHGIWENPRYYLP